MEGIRSEYRTEKSTTITRFLQSPSNTVLKLFLTIILASLLTACVQATPVLPSSTWTIEPSKTATSTSTITTTPSPTSTSTPSPSASPTVTLTASPTPTMVALDEFSTNVLRPGILPMTYIDDRCEALKMRWSAEGSRPGTVVVPVMFHSIVQNGSPIADPNRDISADQFLSFVNYARYLGFETITTGELYDFLTQNARIPTKSMIMIIDDRRPGTIDEWFMPVLEESDWTVTSAYIADPNSLPRAWDLMESLFASGRVDVQSHGYSGQVYIVDSTPLEQIQSEIWNSTPVLEDHFGKQPIAFIWPGGNFTSLSVEVAREGGYKLGFTAYSRGPLMYNWVPLGEKEREVNDPLMVLPRAWSSAVNVNLDDAIKISEQAAEYAEQHFETEAEWFHNYCGGEISNEH